MVELRLGWEEKIFDCLGACFKFCDDLASLLVLQYMEKLEPVESKFAASACNICWEQVHLGSWEVLLCVLELSCWGLVRGKKLWMSMSMFEFCYDDIDKIGNYDCVPWCWNLRFSYEDIQLFFVVGCSYGNWERVTSGGRSHQRHRGGENSRPWRCFKCKTSHLLGEAGDMFWIFL